MGQVHVHVLVWFETLCVTVILRRGATDDFKEKVMIYYKWYVIPPSQIHSSVSRYLELNECIHTGQDNGL